LLLFDAGRGEVDAAFWDDITVTFEVGADLGFPDPEVPVETVLTDSFSGQNKIARIAITSKTITIVGQCAFVNDKNEDACAVCGAGFVEGVAG
jgi:hypothetical protein